MKIHFLEGKKYLFFLLLYLSDVFAFLLAALASLFFLQFEIKDLFFVRFFLFIFLILLVNYSAYGLYNDKRNIYEDQDFINLIYSVGLTLIIALVFVLMFDPGESSLLVLITVSLFLTLCLTMLLRMLIYEVIFFFRREGHDRKRVLFFGHNNKELIEKIRENKSLGYDIVGSTTEVSILKKSLKSVDIVFLNQSQIDDEMLDIMISHEKINWKILSPVLNMVIEPVAFDEFKDYPIINISKTEVNKPYLVGKRVMDVLLSGMSLAVLSPLFLAIAVIIKSTSKGPVFFRQERLGKNLKPFLLYKFRTMVDDAEKQKKFLKSRNEVKGLFKIKDDPRITKIGKFLRRTCIDELPQLINIFRGEMSIVGPRPHLQMELGNFSGWRRARFKVKPGLTGLWQVNGRHELNFDKAVLYDIYYIKHLSLIQDLSIILKTVPAILLSKGKH